MLLRCNRLIMRIMHGYLHAQLEIPDKKGFSRRQPQCRSQCHPAHGNFSMGVPVGPKSSKDAAPWREALRAPRARARGRSPQSRKSGFEPTILVKIRFFI